jgi:hypothetical protein
MAELLEDSFVVKVRPSVLSNSQAIDRISSHIHQPFLPSLKVSDLSPSYNEQTFPSQVST